jgi:hypothetical protein
VYVNPENDDDDDEYPNIKNIFPFFDTPHLVLGPIDNDDDDDDE